jgi:hypothetical protein
VIAHIADRRAIGQLDQQGAVALAEHAIFGEALRVGANRAQAEVVELAHEAGVVGARIEHRQVVGCHRAQVHNRATNHLVPQATQFSRAFAAGGVRLQQRGMVLLRACCCRRQQRGCRYAPGAASATG